MPQPAAVGGELEGRIMVRISPTDDRTYQFFDQVRVIKMRTWEVRAEAKQGKEDTDFSPLELAHNPNTKPGKPKVFTLKIVSAGWGLVEGEHITVMREGDDEFVLEVIKDVRAPSHPYDLKAGSRIAVRNT